MSSVTDKILESIFCILSKGKQEEDRNMFALFVALEVMYLHEVSV